MTHVEEYKRIRKKLIEVHGGVLERATNEDIYEVAEEMDVLENRKIVLVDELEKDAMMDFFIYREAANRKSKVALYKEAKTNQKEEEEKLLKAMVASETSLYEVVEVQREEKMIKLKDIFNPSRVVTIVDLAMSETADKDVLIFTRLIHLDSFSITSGLIFTFRYNHLEFLRKRSRKLMKKVKAHSESDQKFITFFKLNRREGIPFILEDVE